MKKTKEQKALEALGYEVMNNDGRYDIRHSKTGMYSNKPYVGSFTIYSGKYHYDGKEFDDIRSLLECMLADNRQKPFSAEIYANSCANTHPFRGGMIAGCQS